MFIFFYLSIYYFNKPIHKTFGGPVNSSLLNFKYVSSLFFVMLLTSIISLAQEVKSPSSQHHEVPDQTTKFYRSTSNNKTSLPFNFAGEKFFVAQVNVDENGMNILGDAANEPSIAFDFNNPNRIAIGWRQFDHISNDFRQAGYGYTADGGTNWNFPTVIDPGVFRSDPVLDSDSEGNFYYNSLTSDNTGYWCNVYKSEDGGATWDNGTFAYGGDKQWMVIDRTNNPSNGNIYAYWNASYSICESKSFTRSVDKGQSFEECSKIPDDPYWGTLAVDGSGDIYLCGYNDEDFVVIKSKIAKHADSAVTFENPVVVETGGDLPRFGGPNPAGITGQMFIAADTSSGLYGGSVYLLVTQVMDSNNDPADIVVVRSSDGGKTWEAPVRVNDDERDDAYQWFGTLSVAPNGRVDVVWLDTRNANPGEYYSELFYSFSVDGGQTWYPNVNLIEESFDPHVGWPQQNKMGDYYDMVSDNEGVHLAWAATFNGEQDVYYGRIYTDVINGVDDEKFTPTTFTLSQNYPNPFNPSTEIKFNIPAITRSGASSHDTKLIIYDILGREVKTLLNKPLQPGEYKVNFDGAGLPSGVYFYTLHSGSFVETRKMMLLK